MEPTYHGFQLQFIKCVVVSLAAAASFRITRQSPLRISHHKVQTVQSWSRLFEIPLFLKLCFDTRTTIQLSIKDSENSFFLSFKFGAYIALMTLIPVGFRAFFIASACFWLALFGGVKDGSLLKLRGL